MFSFLLGIFGFMCNSCSLDPDILAVLGRCLVLARRDRQLFRTRVLYYDSPAGYSERFTPDPNKGVKARTGVANVTLPPPTVPDWDDCLVSESSDSGRSVSDHGDGNSDGEVSVSSGSGCDDEVTLENRDTLQATMSDVAGWVQRSCSSFTLDLTRRSFQVGGPEDQVYKQPWDVGDVAARYTQIRSHVSSGVAGLPPPSAKEAAKIGHTRIEQLPPQLYAEDSSWHMRFLRKGSMGAAGLPGQVQRIECASALQLENVTRLLRCNTFLKRFTHQSCRGGRFESKTKCGKRVSVKRRNVPSANSKMHTQHIQTNAVQT